MKTIFRIFLKFIDEVSGTKTSYGVIEARGNRMLDIFPISVTKEDLGGLDRLDGPWFSIFCADIFT